MLTPNRRLSRIGATASPVTHDTSTVNGTAASVKVSAEAAEIGKHDVDRHARR